MIYYPLSVLMLTGIREIAIITTAEDQAQFKRLLGDGSQWGIAFTYIVQVSPDGLAQAYLLTEEFLAGAPSAMVLGDNIFFGQGLSVLLREADEKHSGGTIFGYQVSNPQRYGVVDFDGEGNIRAIIEKPTSPPSNFAVTGLYFLDGGAPERARRVKPSQRGELEITSLLETYLHEGTLAIKPMGRGYAWLDAGTHESLLEASNFISTVQKRQGLVVASPDEVAFARNWIDGAKIRELAASMDKNGYGQYLLSLLAD